MPTLTLNKLIGSIVRLPLSFGAYHILAFTLLCVYALLHWPSTTCLHCTLRLFWFLPLVLFGLFICVRRTLSYARWLCFYCLLLVTGAVVVVDSYWCHSTVSRATATANSCKSNCLRLSICLSAILIMDERAIREERWWHNIYWPPKSEKKKAKRRKGGQFGNLAVLCVICTAPMHGLREWLNVIGPKSCNWNTFIQSGFAKQWLWLRSTPANKLTHRDCVCCCNRLI